MNDTQELPIRIKNIYKSCNDTEKELLRNILQELADFGFSQTYEDLWLADYKEIPVDIDTFLCSDAYLGKATRNGQAIYPYWRQVYHDIFDNGNKYEEVFFSGATRIGKSSTAITCIAYMLYKLMCLRDPQKYFGKKDVSKFSVLFFNITKDLAKGVAFREFNDTLKSSPWFNAHGTFSRSERDFYYIPEGDKISIDYGSDAAHGLGKQVYCVVGNTPVLTDRGIKLIKDLENTKTNLAQYSDGGKLLYSPAEVQLTGHVNKTVRIELEDGTILEGTPDHRVMLTDGTYKCLGDLTSSDDLLTFNISEVDIMNLHNREDRFLVYKHTSPNGKVYIGITSKKTSERWGYQGNGYKDNKYFYAAIQKYGWDNFSHEIIATDLSLDDACSLEKKLIAECNSACPEKGYNQTDGGEHSSPSQEVRKRLHDTTSANWKDPNFRQKVISGLAGHEVSDETKLKISSSKLGKRCPNPSPLKGRKLSAEHVEKLKNKPAWNKGLTKDTHSGIAAGAEKLKQIHKTDEWKDNISKAKKKKFEEGYNCIWVNNQISEMLVDASAEIPEGYVRGRLHRDEIFVFKDDRTIKVSKDEAEKYLSQGWKLGRGESTHRSLKSANQKFRWIYEGRVFSSAPELADYLKNHGYPKIVGSTITALYNKGFSSSRHYASLEGKIIREEIS